MAVCLPSHLQISTNSLSHSDWCVLNVCWGSVWQLSISSISHTCRLTRLWGDGDNQCVLVTVRMWEGDRDVWIHWQVTWFTFGCGVYLRTSRYTPPPHASSRSHLKPTWSLSLCPQPLTAEVLKQRHCLHWGWSCFSLFHPAVVPSTRHDAHSSSCCCRFNITPGMDGWTSLRPLHLD